MLHIKVMVGVIAYDIYIECWENLWFPSTLWVSTGAFSSLEQLKFFFYVHSIHVTERKDFSTRLQEKLIHYFFPSQKNSFWFFWDLPDLVWGLLVFFYLYIVYCLLFIFIFSRVQDLQLFHVLNDVQHSFIQWLKIDANHFSVPILATRMEIKSPPTKGVLRSCPGKYFKYLLISCNFTIHA